MYIENGTGTPEDVEISDKTLENAFEDNNKGWLTFKCDLSELQKTLNLENPIYSPAEAFIRKLVIAACHDAIPAPLAEMPKAIATAK